MSDILDLMRVREEPLGSAETESLFDRIFEGKLSDEQLLAYLARADLAAGDASAAERMLRKAITLAPRRTDLWTDLGMTLMGADSSLQNIATGIVLVLAVLLDQVYQRRRRI